MLTARDIAWLLVTLGLLVAFGLGVGHVVAETLAQINAALTL